MDVSKPTTEALKLASQILSRGGIVIYPTESSYAIGADATNSEAVSKLRSIKGRDDKPIGVIVGSLEIAEQYCYLTEEERKLANKYMPGPLTICSRKKPNVPDILNKERFSFRVPGDKTARKLAQLFRKPITATSANLSGEKPIYCAAELKAFYDKVDLVLDAGDLEERPHSTIIEDGKVVRQGAISLTKTS